MKILIPILLMLYAGAASAQQLAGTIMDKQTGEPVKGAIIRSASGTATSGLKGQFLISVLPSDTLFIYSEFYQGFRLPLSNTYGPVKIELTKSRLILKEVIISARRNDPTDSLENRADFDKEFNYKPPAIKDAFIGSAPRSRSTLVSLNLGMLYSVLTRKKNKAYQFSKRLRKDEEERFIDRSFNAAVVADLTSLSGKELEDFMSLYRPTYDFVKSRSAYQLMVYIKSSYAAFKAR